MLVHVKKDMQKEIPLPRSQVVKNTFLATCNLAKKNPISTYVIEIKKCPKNQNDLGHFFL